MKAYSDIVFGTGYPCQMCRALRACEQRVRKEESRKVIGSVSLAAIGEANVQQYQRGYVAGLDAARDAVAGALERGLADSTDKALYYFEADEDDPSLGYDVTFHKQDLLAAIDALREEQK